MTEGAHNYVGMGLDGRLITLCAKCRKETGALAFQGMGQTIRPCEKCGKTAGTRDAD